MKVEIWSDVMCPFCYLGKKNFEKALKDMPFKNEVEIVWKSFQLDPTLASDDSSISALEYLSTRKRLPKEHILGMFSNLKQKGSEVGINFKQDISKITNTFNAHRLIHFAQSKGKGSEMEEALFKAHFTDGKHVGSLNELADIAVSIGLDRNEVSDILKSEKYSDEVRKDIEEAGELGITSVPFFVVNRKYGVSGAQAVVTFKDTLKQAYEESKPKFEMKGEKGTNQCDSDGCDI